MDKETQKKLISVVMTVYFIVVFFFLAFAFVGIFDDTYSDLISKITKVFLEM